jgi:hypothetical protein
MHIVNRLQCNMKTHSSRRKGMALVIWPCLQCTLRMSFVPFPEARNCEGGKAAVFAFE